MLKKSSASPWPAARRRGFSASSPRVSELIFRKTFPTLTFPWLQPAARWRIPRRVSAKEAEMGLSFSSDLHEAFHGLEKFKDKPLTNLRAIGLVCFRRRPFDHLRGQRHPHREGPGRQTRRRRKSRVRNVRQCRAGFSHPWASGTRSTASLSLGPAAGEAMTEGKADAFFWTGPEPDRVTMEAATKKPMRAIDIYTPVSKTDFFKQYPYFARYVFPANSYSGITEDTSTVGVPVIWYCQSRRTPLRWCKRWLRRPIAKKGTRTCSRSMPDQRTWCPKKLCRVLRSPCTKAPRSTGKPRAFRFPKRSARSSLTVNSRGRSNSERAPCRSTGTWPSSVMMGGVSLFYLWASSFGVLSLQYFRGVAVLYSLVVPLIFTEVGVAPGGRSACARPVARRGHGGGRSLLDPRTREMAYRAGDYTLVDVWMGVIVTIVAIEAARRVLGLGMAMCAILPIAYALFGSYLPFIIGHRGFTRPANH